NNNIYVSKNLLNKNEYLLCRVNEAVPNGILSIIKHNNLNYYIHIKNNEIYVTPYVNGNTNRSIDIKYEKIYKGYEIEKTKYSYNITDQVGNEHVIGNEIFLTGHNTIDTLERTKNTQKYIYLKFTYENIVSFLEYTLATTQFSFKTSYIKVIDSTEQLKILMKSNNTFKLNDESNQIIKINNLLKNKIQKITLKNNVKNFKPIIIKINNRVFVLSHIKNQIVKIEYDTRANLLFNSTFISSKATRRGIE